MTSSLLYVKLILGAIAAIAGIIAGILGNELAPIVVYRITKRGRPPSKKDKKVWVVFYVAVIAFVLTSTSIVVIPSNISVSPTINNPYPLTPISSFTLTSVPTSTPTLTDTSMYLSWALSTTPTDTLVTTLTPTAKPIPMFTRTDRPIPTFTLIPTATKMIPCTDQPLACYEADIFTESANEPVFEGVGLSCGPKGGYVLGNEANFRFTRGIESIKDGIFPERKLPFACISQVDFLEMSEEEKKAVDSYYQQRSDFYNRKWQKARITFFDGTIWDDVFIYDNCSFETSYETVNIKSFDVVKIVFRAKENCK
jgi:hypothetical protein